MHLAPLLWMGAAGLGVLLLDRAGDAAEDTGNAALKVAAAAAVVGGAYYLYRRA